MTDDATKVLRMRLLLAGLLICLAVAPARAQIDSRDGIVLQNQILELRRDLQALRDQMARGGGGSSLGGQRPVAPPAAGGSEINAALLERVARLEDDVRGLRGQLEQSENARQRMNDELTKQIGDLNFKLGTPAPAPAYAPPAPTVSPPPGNIGTVPAPPGPPARRTAELAIQEGNAALARRDYAAAESAAREVIAGPRSPRIVDAQFLLAQALTGRRDYQGAAIAFDDTYNRGRTGSHAADSLLGLANSLAAIGEKRAACATLDKLHAEFPTPRPDLKDPIAAGRAKAGCR